MDSSRRSTAPLVWLAAVLALRRFPGVSIPYNPVIGLTLLKLPAGAKLVEGEATRQLGQLAGRTTQRSTASWWGYTPGTPERAFADWIVAAPAGASFGATANHERAGSANAELVLGAKAK